jgi:hypothetical protein
LEYLKNWQVFLTCCDTTHVSRLQSYKTFRIENGAYMGE